MDAISEIKGTLHLILRKLAELKPERKPLTRAEFARKTGYSYSTIIRRIEAGEIKLRDGRIPASELDKYLS